MLNKTNSDNMTFDFSTCEWLRLEPKGVVFEGGHFVFILENEEKRAVLPVRYPAQAADLLAVGQSRTLWRKSLGYLLRNSLGSWGIEFRRCVFIKHQKGQHTVRLYYIKDGESAYIEAALDQVLGICMEGQLPYYATRAYIAESQILEPDNEIFLQKQRWTEGAQRYLM